MNIKLFNQTKTLKLMCIVEKHEIKLCIETRLTTHFDQHALGGKHLMKSLPHNITRLRNQEQSLTDGTAPFSPSVMRATEAGKGRYFWGASKDARRPRLTSNTAAPANKVAPKSVERAAVTAPRRTLKKPKVPAPAAMESQWS